MDSTGVVVVLATVPSAEVGQRLARRLVEERLAACVSVVPSLRSFYRWEGRVEEAPEQMLVVKTRAERFAALAGRIRELHPYGVPEILALPAVAGDAPYLAWVAESVSRGGDESDEE